MSTVSFPWSVWCEKGLHSGDLPIIIIPNSFIYLWDYYWVTDMLLSNGVGLVRSCHNLYTFTWESVALLSLGDSWRGRKVRFWWNKNIITFLGVVKIQVLILHPKGALFTVATWTLSLSSSSLSSTAPPHVAYEVVWISYRIFGQFVFGQIVNWAEYSGQWGCQPGVFRHLTFVYI